MKDELIEKLEEAKRWMGQLPRDQFDLLLALVNDARWHERERCAKLAENFAGLPPSMLVKAIRAG